MSASPALNGCENAEQPYGIRLHRGRRGRVAVVRLPRGGDAEATARLAAEHTVALRVRWLVLDVSEVRAGCDVARLVQAVRRRTAHAGVGVAVTGGDARGGAARGAAPGCPLFPTVPLALGTLGGM